MKLLQRLAPFLMALAALMLFASPAAGMPLIDAETTNADAYGASEQDAPKAMLLTLSAPEPQQGLQMVAPGAPTAPTSVIIYVEEPMDGGTSLFIWKDAETDGFLMAKDINIPDGGRVPGFLMNEDGEMTGIIINKINGLFVFNDRESGLILWQGHPNKFIIGP